MWIKELIDELDLFLCPEHLQHISHVALKLFLRDTPFLFLVYDLEDTFVGLPLFLLCKVQLSQGCVQQVLLRIVDLFKCIY